MLKKMLSEYFQSNIVTAILTYTFISNIFTCILCFIESLEKNLSLSPRLELQQYNDMFKFQENCS